MKTIKLHGGPWNKRVIRDSGTVQIRLAIAREWEGQRPKIGTLAGTAIYAPTESRDRAHWIHNEWDGVVDGIIEA